MKNKKIPENIKALRNRLKHSELLQSSLYKIAQAAHSTQSLYDLYSAIHNIISKLMYADNFYIAIGEALKMNFENLFKKIKVYKIENKFKDFKENREWQIKSWKKNKCCHYCYRQ